MQEDKKNEYYKIFPEFPKRKEGTFRRYYLKVKRMQILIAGLLAIILYAVFGILDNWVIWDITRFSWTIRYLVVCPFSAYVVFSIYYSRSEPVVQVLLCSAMLVASCGIISMIALSTRNGAHVYYAGLSMLVLYCYTFLGMRIVYSTACGLLVTAAYIITETTLRSHHPALIINNIFFLIATNIVGIFAGYMLERFLRNEYLQRLSLKQANRQLRRLSVIDALTQIANRRCFDIRFSQEWDRAHRTRQPISLLFLDIDFFKRFNDTRGHAAGDKCLVQIAAKLKQLVKRSIDLVSRYGGEEFAIVLPDITLKEALKLAEKIRITIEEMHILHPDSSVSDYVTASIGVASIIPSDQHIFSDLTKASDVALYRAKKTGRNKIEAFDVFNADQIPPQ